MSVWRTNALGKHADIRARIGWRGLSSTEYQSNGPFLIAGQHIRQGRVDWEACDHISEARYDESPEIALRTGDVIISKDGTIGRVARIEVLRSRATLNGTMMLVRPRPSLDYRFLYHFLSGHSFKKLIDDKVSGSSIPHLFQRDMVGLSIKCPKVDEQIRIAAVLDTVDDAILRTEAVIAKLKQVRAGLLHDLLTRGLDEHGQLRDPIAHPEQFNDSPLGRIPRGWRFSKFDDVLDGIDAGKSPDYPDYPAPPGEWGVLKVSAVWPEGFRPHENKWVTKATDQVPSYQVQNGDLLISRSNTYELVGIVCLVVAPPPRLMLCDKTLRLRLKPTRGLNSYFALVLQTPTARTHLEVNATGTSGSMKNISQDVIRALPLAYPEVDEQSCILAAVEPVGQDLDVLGYELRKLIAMKCGLMADLLTGRVRVPEHVGVGGAN